MILIVEGIVMCFVLLVVCVVGIANGPVGLVLLYEEDVQQRWLNLDLPPKKRSAETLLFVALRYSYHYLSCHR